VPRDGCSSDGSSLTAILPLLHCAALVAYAMVAGTSNELRYRQQPGSEFMGRYRRYWIAIAVVAVLVGAYALAGFLAVPYFARNSLQSFVRTHYNRALSIREIRFNPFTFTVDVTGLSLPDADGSALLSFDRLHVDLKVAASLWHLGPSFNEILLEQPYVRAVVRPHGALNLADLGKGFAAPAQPERPSAPLRLYITRFAIIGGAAYFEDRTRTSPFRAEFKPIAFELHDFSTTGRRSEDAYTLEAASPDGERLRWSGTLRLEPLLSHGAFEVADLKARTIWNYLRTSLPFEIDSGMIGIKGEYDLGNSGNGGNGLGMRIDVHTATVSRLGIKPNGAQQHYVELGNIALDELRADLTSRRIELTKVTLADGDIKAWMSEQGKLNLLELLGPANGSNGPVSGDSTESHTPPATPAALPPPAMPASATSASETSPSRSKGSSEWHISVPEVIVERFKVSVEDRQVRPAATLLLDPLRVHIAGFSNAADDTLDITLETGVNGTGKLNVHAKAASALGALSAHIEATDLGLTMLQPYIARYTAMTLLQGKLGSRLDVERDASGTLKVKGNTFVADLRTVDNALKQDFIKWKGLRIADMSYVSKPATLRIGSITALEPYARVFVAPDRTLNIKQILTPPGKAPASAPPPSASAPAASAADEPPQHRVARHKGSVPAPDASAKGAPGQVVQTATAPPGPVTPFPVSIGALRVVDGSANYADLWIKPSFSIGIQSLGGEVTGLSSDPNSRAKVQLEGRVNRYSPITIAGTVNLLSAALFSDIHMDFKDLDLTVVNPYSGYFTGWRIDKGKLSVDVSYKVQQRKLEAAQHFVVDQLEIGNRVDSPDATHLPLKLAVSLLKDRNGVIDLNLPMSGSLDDPSFRIGPIIWKMFENLIVKAATAPFALLGRLIGHGGEHMNEVEFRPGAADIDPPAKDQLDSLAHALQERPQVKLDVPMAYSAGLDRPKIAEKRLQDELLARVLKTREGKKYPETAGQIALSDPAKHYALLLEQFHADLGRDAALPASAAALEAAKGKGASYDQAISDLQAALVGHIAVPDGDLETLGKERAQAIQHALVSDGHIDAARVFIVNAPPKPDSGDTVKVELAIKGA
jgi:uncharacterized protein DUF748